MFGFAFLKWIIRRTRQILTGPLRALTPTKATVYFDNFEMLPSRNVYIVRGRKKMLAEVGRRMGLRLGMGVVELGKR